MKKIMLLVLAVAACGSLSAGRYHNSGMKKWATGSYTISVETSTKVSEIRIISYDNPVKVVWNPDYDTSFGVKNGDTLTIDADVPFLIPTDHDNRGFTVIRDGGATSLAATWR